MAYNKLSAFRTVGIIIYPINSTVIVIYDNVNIRPFGGNFFIYGVVTGTRTTSVIIK